MSVNEPRIVTRSGWRSIIDNCVPSGTMEPMGEQHNVFSTPDEHGHWEDKVFVFDNEITIPTTSGPVTVTRLDTSTMVLDEGITRDDVVHAMLNPVVATGVISGDF